MEQALAIFGMFIEVVERNAPQNEELRKTLEETRKFVSIIRKNSSIVEKWIKKEHPEWKTLTLYFRGDKQDKQDEQEDFVL